MKMVALVALTVLLLAAALLFAGPGGPSTIWADPLPGAAQGRVERRAVEEGPPDWAFIMDPAVSAAPDRRPRDAVPQLAIALTRASDPHKVVDWRPDQHPPAPGIVSHGKPRGTAGCAFCHRYNGMGTPANAPLAGLAVPYLVGQIEDFRSGARGTARPAMASFHYMSSVTAAGLTDDETRQAAKYFATLKRTPWIKVIETETVPKHRSRHYVLMPDPGAAREPIGSRIIETPADALNFDLRNDGYGFIAYVPPGSVEKGRALAAEGGDGKTVPCRGCHGADLRGGQAPGGVAAPYLASGSPSNIARQLYNYQSGARKGPHAQLMAPVVQDLTMDDIVNLAAYLAAIKP